MDKYFDVDEMMIEYSEMAGFDFGSKAFQEIKREVSEYSKQLVHKILQAQVSYTHPQSSLMQQQNRDLPLKQHHICQKI